jgi:hypothetical protein
MQQQGTKVMREGGDVSPCSADALSLLTSCRICLGLFRIAKVHVAAWPKVVECSEKGKLFSGNL